MVLKENAGAEDGRGLSLFGRFGCADDDVNPIRAFRSEGAQYQGLIPTRDDDILGFGVAQGGLAEGAGFSAAHETVMEMYYKAAITPWLSVSASIQYVFHPGGDSGDDAVVPGLRVQSTF
jgi:porin